MKPPLQFVPNEDFKDHWKEFIKPMEGYDDLLRMAESRKANLESMCEMPILTKEQEQYLFRQFNALKYGANHVERRYEELKQAAAQVRNVIVLCNYKLGVGFLKNKAFSTEKFFDRLGDSSLLLCNCVDKFDFSFGYKFSTYVMGSFWKVFSRADEVEQRLSKMMSFDDKLVEEVYEIDLAERITSEEQQLLLGKLTEGFDERTLDCVCSNIGVYGPRETLEEIGKRHGITSTAAKSIKGRAMKTMRNRYAEA